MLHIWARPCRYSVQLHSQRSLPRPAKPSCILSAYSILAIPWELDLCSESGLHLRGCISASRRLIPDTHCEILGSISLVVDQKRWSYVTADERGSKMAVVLVFWPKITHDKNLTVSEIEETTSHCHCCNDLCQLTSWEGWRWWRFLFIYSPTSHGYNSFCVIIVQSAYSKLHAAAKFIRSMLRSAIWPFNYEGIVYNQQKAVKIISFTSNCICRLSGNVRCMPGQEVTQPLWTD